MLDDTLLTEIRALAALAVTEDDTTHTAEAVVSMAIETVGTDHGSLTVFRPNGRLVTMAPTAPAIAEADRLQYELGEGPCVEAAWEAATYVSDDLTADERWPVWAPKAAATGLRALLASRLEIGDRVLGALNLYCDRPHRFTDEDREHARIFASHATATLITVQERQNLRMAVDSRTVIGQAQGILMARYELDEAQSFSVLRRLSQTNNRKLRELAADIVRHGTLPEG